MHYLRSPWLCRVVVAVLVAAMLPVLGASMPDRSSVHVQHANWLRSHLAGSISQEAAAAIDQALQEAEADAPFSLEAYTEAFARSYQRQVTASAAEFTTDAPLPSLASLFSEAGIDAASLYSHLRYRGMQGTPPAVLPRFQVTPSAAGPIGPFRALGVAKTTTLPPVAWVAEATLDEETGYVAVRLLLTLWSAQPLGP